jgi:hypothetical protein
MEAIELLEGLLRYLKAAATITWVSRLALP